MLKNKDAIVIIEDEAMMYIGDVRILYPHIKTTKVLKGIPNKLCVPSIPNVFCPIITKRELNELIYVDNIIIEIEPIIALI